jgi:CBS domain-containing protein
MSGVTIVAMSLALPSGRDLTEHVHALQDVDTEAGLRHEIDRAADAVAAEPRAHAPALASAWSTVLRHAVAAGVRMAGPAPWTWFVSGSAARGEAVPGSDVETMVVLTDDVDDADKAGLLDRAAHVHALLERCGILGDANGVLASRPRFCRRQRSWAEGIERWAAEPERDRGVVMTGLMADADGLEPDAGGLLRDLAVSAAAAHYPVRQAMVQDATAVRATVPSRLRLFVSSGDAVDVKRAVIDPVVKIARWAALSTGSTALPTRERLARGQAGGLLDADDAALLQEAHLWLLRFRWRGHLAALRTGRPVGDVVSLGELSPQDRAALRGVARDVSGVMRKLTYLSSVSAFADR